MSFSFSTHFIIKLNLFQYTQTTSGQSEMHSFLLEHPSPIKNRSKRIINTALFTTITVIWRQLGLICFLRSERSICKMRMGSGLAMLLIMHFTFVWWRCHVGRLNIFLSWPINTICLREITSLRRQNKKVESKMQPKSRK